MWDTRMLTLYKQHYMDYYDQALPSEYSCWGYYDGMDLAKVEQKQYSSLYEENIAVPVSCLWYGAGQKTAGITGRYGSINIGLFCDTSEKEELEAFWSEKESSLFLGVSFLQLSDLADYKAIGRKVKELLKESSNTEKKCYSAIYYTYDNADLVLLINGNSLSELEHQLQKVDKLPEIRYQHSILGVSENYLKECKSKKKILDEWKGKRCFIEEELYRLDIRFVSSGEEQIPGVEKRILDKVHSEYIIKNYEKMVYAYVSGHENMMISLADTDIKSMLALLLPGGFATHQNESYEQRVDRISNQIQPCLYNLETSYVLQDNRIDSITYEEEIKDGSQKSVPAHNWFQKKMKKYRKKMKEALFNGDESLYSYYQALQRTLNVLVQYERFHPAGDIFYLLYPSFKMFDEKLDKALADKNNINENFVTMKQSMCEFLEAVNSVIYHTVHTDQVYLMVPGYSGTSFSIPIKLSMFFLWFTDSVAQILGNSNREYRCILAPTIEAKPVTHWMKFEHEHEHEKFLVCVKTSQRILYMPKAFLIILAHEMGHYIGGDLRNRKKRADQMKEYTAQYLTNMIFPEKGSEGSIKERLRDAFSKETKKAIESAFGEIQNEEYYGDDVQKALLAACRKVLSNCGRINSINLRTLYDTLDVKEERQIGQIYRILEEAEEKADTELTNGNLYDIIGDELKAYKESFSDLVAWKILGFDKASFEEAYRVSEGSQKVGEEIIRRSRMLASLGMKTCEGEDTECKLLDSDIILNEYLRECNKRLEDRLKMTKRARPELFKKIGQLCQLLYGQGAEDFYDLLVFCIQDMKRGIERDMLQKSRGQECIKIHDEIIEYG